MNNPEIFYLAGMPRSGSTLLLNILKQNKEFHIEGTSALADFMWNSFQAGIDNSFELLVANNRFPSTTHDIVSGIPSIFYKDVKTKYIIDKNRKWCSAANVGMIKQCFNEHPKIIILTRKTHEVVSSYINIMQQNNKPDEAVDNFLNLENNELILDSVASVMDAKKFFKDDFLFIDYADLISDTKNQIKNIYEYLEIDFFEHDFENIIDYNLENDEAYGLDGLHSVRSKIELRQNNVVLNDKVLKTCYDLDQHMRLNQ